jgi:hypothetical protein
MKIIPDDGHTWTEVNADSTHTDFVCACGAHFSHDMTDDSVEYDEGDGHSED